MRTRVRCIPRTGYRIPLVLGLLIGVQGCSPTFEAKISLAELLDLLLTIAVAVIIPLWIHRFVEKKTRLRGSVGRVAEQAFGILTDIQNHLERARDDSPMDELTQRREVIARLKQCSNLLTLLDEALTALGQDRKGLTKTLKKHLLEYKKVVTSRAMPTATFVPTPQQIASSRTQFRAFGKTYFELISGF